MNVLQQLEHIMSYPFVRERVEAGELRLHGWWFDIARVEVLAHDPDERRFLLVDEREGARNLGKKKG